MPAPRSAWYALDLGIKDDEANLANSDVLRIGGIVPFDGYIREVWAGVSGALPTAGTLAVSKEAGTDATVLAATLNLNTGLTVNVASSLTLATPSAALRVTAGNIIAATWTLTSITATDDSPFCCLVMIEPDIW